MRYTNLSGHARRELLARLEQMPEFVAKSFADLPRSLHATPGPAGGFSPVEQAWHLADLEAIAFAERIRRLRAEMNPRLPDFAGDDVARERNYRALSLREGIVAFRKAREQNLSELRRIGRQEWERHGVQEGVGPISLCDLPSMMAEHDASHRLEISAWIDDVQRRAMVTPDPRKQVGD